MAPEMPASTCPTCGLSLSGGDVHGLCAACLATSLEETMLLLGQEPSNDELDALPSIPGYQLLKPLGIGGMGQVYSAVSLDDPATPPHPLAIKVLSRRWSADPDSASRFLSEGDMLRQLNHPNIVTILATGQTEADERLYIVMEVVEGCDLGRLLRAEKLSSERSIELFLKVCAALTHAHSKGIIHRDVKPSNILIGKDGTVKLADFGLARHLIDEHTHYGWSPQLTETRDTFGTPYYIAPEVLRGGATMAPTIDVYAMGVLLYHLLTGSPPLGAYTPVSELTDLPAKLDAVITSALQADPAKRTSSIEELARGVEAVWDLYHRHQGRTRSWRSLGKAAAILMGIVGAAIGGYYWAKEQNRPPAPRQWPSPTIAKLNAPWKNSLDMSFIPVGDGEVLFCQHETRRRDYEPFFIADRAIMPMYRSEETGRAKERRVRQVTDSGWANNLTSWDKPGFDQTPDHPVVGVTYLDASLFCSWLTFKERSEGRLPAPWRYRLPTEQEWKRAAESEHGRNALSANLAGPEAQEPLFPKDWPIFSRRDPFPRTAPVGSFPASSVGLHDMGGNVNEWVANPMQVYVNGPNEGLLYTMCGGSWASGQADHAGVNARRRARKLAASTDTGFRCVLAKETEEEE